MPRTPHWSPRPFPSGRYHKTNPLRRLFGLRLLAEALPEPLRASLIHAWMLPGRYDGNQAIPGRECQRPPQERLPFLPLSLLDIFTLIELEIGRRIVEIPRTEITREERNRLLREQAAYLRSLYNALAAQLGEAAALAAFERSLLKVA
jgi:hypothetical protein